MRADGKNRELALLPQVTDDVYEWQKSNNTGDKFIIHDGPPYANGSLHLGHFLNKTLKDFINRYKVLQGFNVDFRPGWDCHGLPIELKALQEAKYSANQNISPLEIRSLAKKCATSAIQDQKASFIRWGIMGDWNNPYLTMDHVYESRQIQVFMDMVEKGLIYRDLKPVHWSPSSRTALAEAELEYPEGHKSTSAYISFPIKKLPSPFEKTHASSDCEAIIWTTTPWTIPANKAIAAGPDISYVFVRDVKSQKQYLIAKDRLDHLQQKMDTSFEVTHECLGKDLEGTVCQHPMYDRESPIIVGSHVTTESGTGLVHTAPGHGHDDYLVCKKYNIPVYCPVGDDGCFTKEIADEELVGKDVLGDGNRKVLEILQTRNRLVKHEKYEHKYPYDWRTKKPIITRATKQWFIRVNKIVSDAISAIQTVEMVPPSGRARLESMLKERSEWCISRQRVWGVPIPVFYDTETDEPLLTKESVSHVQRIMSEHGSSCWWEMDVGQLLAPQYRNNGRQYRKGGDTMDVWFDSGASWFSVVHENSLPYPVDLYLEGSDQHRGWFQSSLLTSIAAKGQAPYKKILTHGFTLDGKGRKMSKSLGNVVDPKQVVEGPKGVGAEVLRWWVASTDYTWDVVMSDIAFEKVQQSYSKVRNTCRFILANTADYIPAESDASKLRSIDRYMLHTLADFSKSVTKEYEAYAFGKVFTKVNQYVVSDLSNFYFDITKDRLYASGPDSPERKSVQYVMDKILRSLVTAIAPITPCTSQDIYNHMPQKTSQNVFYDGWLQIDPTWNQPELSNDWAWLRGLREQSNILLEKCRQEKSIGSAVEAKVFMCVEPNSRLQEVLSRTDADSIQEMLSTSGVLIHYGDPSVSKGDIVNQKDALVDLNFGGHSSKVYLAVGPAGGSKCVRCWKQYDETTCSHGHKNADLCPRCDIVIESNGVLKEKVDLS
eukprot:TRINITY_DN2124_c0_g1_i8.p1 TRINITY_DN2124_c0_g1~~TRINITY_DN2124_c0_g1_i8.p1  ORF type:complete len:941 (+),score=141.98 TRINITY_DN2124_c0_g1_i8:198-3020(+)